MAPTRAAIRGLCDGGATLIVCVDCGIAAHAALAEAGGRAEVVVLDHHKAEGPVPPVAAVVNPNRLDCGSGLRHLCAAAVAFLAVVALHRALRRAGHFSRTAEPSPLDLLDLVALATVCDVMPLTGVNRALVTQGLKVMAQRGHAGVAALLDVGQVRDVPTAHSLGFVAGAADQCRRPGGRARPRAAPAAVRRPGRGARHGRAAGCGEPAPPGGGGGGARAPPSPRPRRRLPAGHAGAAGAGRGLASRRGRHRRRADQGTLQPARPASPAWPAGWPRGPAARCRAWTSAPPSSRRARPGCWKPAAAMPMAAGFSFAAGARSRRCTPS